MKGILWYATRKLEGIFDGILMEFYIKSSEDKNQILKSMYIPRFLSSGLYGRSIPGGWGNSCYLINFATILLVVLLTFIYFLQKNNIRFNVYMLLLLRLNQIHFLRRHQ